jgi:predicted NAD/FAD-binding protein
MTHLLERFPVGLFDVTLFEATARLGGKILTQRFDTIPAIYEAGVAIPMHGYAVVLGEETLPMVAVTTAELSQSTTPSKRWPTSWPTP